MTNGQDEMKKLCVGIMKTPDEVPLPAGLVKWIICYANGVMQERNYWRAIAEMAEQEPVEARKLELIP